MKWWKIERGGIDRKRNEKNREKGNWVGVGGNIVCNEYDMKIRVNYKNMLKNVKLKWQRE